MPKEILPNIHLIEVPLPGNPLKSLNSYLVRGHGRNLLIDTGFNHEECRRALTAALAALDVDMDRTDIFLTHMHSDHCGLAYHVASPTSKIYISKKDHAYMMQVISPDGWEKINNYLSRFGFSEAEITENRLTNPIQEYAPSLDTVYVTIEDGFMLDLGAYRLQAIETPGHTPGHMCLYAGEQKLLFCGDHIIFDISPNITSWRDERIPLRLYMESLEHVRKLDVRTALSAHRQATGSCRKRIDELLIHHRARLQEAYETAKKHPYSTAYEIASEMTWVSCTGWQGFSISQKWFAVGEAMAHLEYLVAQGSIIQETAGGQFRFL
ncbi:MAG: MBL fold metallo-hydrolase [Synergistaceae bacterium]|jgi:glyoxylase-like metal-dependent hydrolase (beta-lactamase superfamily II)|nr:MBL fold metallo-hydrolase [Synergistaceae bacterium]